MSTIAAARPALAAKPAAERARARARALRNGDMPIEHIGQRSLLRIADRTGRQIADDWSLQLVDEPAGAFDQLR